MESIRKSIYLLWEQWIKNYDGMAVLFWQSPFAFLDKGKSAGGRFDWILLGDQSQDRITTHVHK
jgi:hypothetical protein